MKIKLVLTLFVSGILLFSVSLYAQNEVQASKSIGFRVNSFYDFQLKKSKSDQIVRVAPVLSLDFKKHNFYLGPQFTRYLQFESIRNEKYESESLGLNFGYRLTFKELVQNLRLFGQFDYAIYQIKNVEIQKGAPFLTNEKTTIAQNTIFIGIDYIPFKAFSCFIGTGIGSLDGFFMMIDDFIVSSYIGLEYKF